MQGSLTNRICSIPSMSTPQKGHLIQALWLLFFLCPFCSPDVSFADVTLLPRITTGVVYDDNFFLDPVDEQYDVAIATNPGFDLKVTGQKAELGIIYNPTYFAYMQFPENDYWSQQGTLTGWAEIARGIRLEFNDALLYTEDPISETDTTVRRGREPYLTNTADIGMVSRFGADSVFELRYEYYVLNNDSPTVEDKSYQNPNALVTYWFSPNRYAVELEGSYTVSDFEVSEDFEELDARGRLIKRFGRHLDAYVEYSYVYYDYLDSGEDYRVYNPLAGFSWQEQENTRLAASFGYFYRDNEISDDDDGIVGSIETVYNWAEGSSIAFNGEAGYDLASFGAQDLGFNPFYSVQGAVTHPFGRRLVGNILAGYRINQYPDETPDRDDTLIRVGCGLAFQALPWMTVRLDYLFQKLNSNINTEDYTDNRGILSVTFAPRQPVKLFNP